MKITIAQRILVVLILNLILGNWANAQKKIRDKRDRQVYKTIKIGTQTWLRENLRYQTTGAYKNPEHPNKKYGLLYTWQAAIKACPDQWHLPSDEEWKILESYLGMTEYEFHPIYKTKKQSLDADGDRISGEIGRILKSKTGWINNQNGIDSIHFSVLPAGLYSNKHFRNEGRNAYFWTSTSISNIQAAFARIFHPENGIIRIRESIENTQGYSVRCIKD